MDTRTKILTYIRTYARANGYPPTYAEIGDGCHLSKTGVAY